MVVILEKPVIVVKITKKTLSVVARARGGDSTSGGGEAAAIGARVDAGPVPAASTTICRNRVVRRRRLGERGE
jgi:hypothetical protein